MRVNKSPQLQLQGLVQDLKVTGMTIATERAPSTASSPEAKQLETIMASLGRLGTAVAASKKASRATAALNRGVGTDFGKQDEAWFKEVFDNPPTKDTISFFPGADVNLKNPAGLRAWATTVINGRVEGMDEDTRNGYTSVMLPKLIEWGADYVGQRTAAEEQQRINIGINSLASNGASISDTLTNLNNNLNFQYDAVTTVDKIIIPSIETAIQMGNLDQAAELINYTVSGGSVLFGGDPVKSSALKKELKKSVNSRILPTLPVVVSQSVESNDFTTARTIFKNAGGVTNDTAVKNMVEGVRNYMQNEEGVYIEDRLSAISTVQGLSWVQKDDKLYGELAKLQQTAIVEIESERNKQVANMEALRKEDLFQATNMSLEVIHGQGTLTEADLLQKFRDDYGRRGELYVSDYYKLKKQFKNNTEGTSAIEEDLEVVANLRSSANASWTPYTAKVVQADAAKALIDEKITRPTYTALINSIKQSEIKTLVNQAEGLSRNESEIEKIFWTSHGLDFKKDALGNIEEIIGDLEGFGSETLSRSRQYISTERTEFRREFTEWHYTGTDENGTLVSELLSKPGGERAYEKARDAELKRLFGIYSERAIVEGNTRLENKGK